MRLVLMIGLAVLASVHVTGAEAQTAGDINRLNAAIQICNSPAGSTMPECAKLRGQLGVPGGVGGGGTASALGGLLGALNSARSAPAAPAAPPVNTAAVQQGVAACVRNAAGDTAAIQACLSGAAQAPAAPRPSLGIGAYQSPAAAAPPPGLGIGAYQAQAAGGTASGDASMAIYRSGQSYQACAAANPANWQSCLPLLNGGAPPR